MSSPSKEELPKIEASLKGELLKEHHLKSTTVSEKQVLPTAEDLKRERTHEGVLQGVTNFSPDSLKHIKTREPATATEVMQVEFAHQSSLKEVHEFNKTNLKSVEVNEKNPLPDSEAIKLEAEHNKFKDGIENFDKEKLAHTKTIEKNTLPTKDQIQEEKSA